MADTTLQLGDFTFSGFEVPEEIPFGGEQMLAVHKLVGGARVIDAMGSDDISLDWGGRLRGPNALDRALYLDTLRKAGAPLSLTWSSLSYTVVIKRFVCTFQRYYELPYQISCEVVSDNTSPLTSSPATTVDDQVGSDLTDADGLGDDVADPTLTADLGGVSSAVAAVSTFVGAGSTQINSVLGPLAVAQARVAALQATNTATISVAGTFCGMQAGASPAALAASLSGYATSMTALAALNDVGNLLGRISTNLQADGASGAVLTLAGGSLYDVAAKAYGDPAEWSTLGKANGLADPTLMGVNTIRVPAQPDGAGGVWQD